MKYCLYLLIIIGFLGNVYCESNIFDVAPNSKSCIIEVPTVKQFKGNCIKLSVNVYGCAAGLHLDPFNSACMEFKN
uniref:Secreted protein n=1 Tax=Strongyloides stercoralis TaxID=6248 RepID=A0A0K0EGD5_STRER